MTLNKNRGVYVLSCQDNKYYVGSTEYLTKRIYSHIYGYEFRGMKRFTAWTKISRANIDYMAYEFC